VVKGRQYLCMTITTQYIFIVLKLLLFYEWDVMKRVKVNDYDRKDAIGLFWDRVFYALRVRE
jgi:hypothetical protein